MLPGSLRDWAKGGSALGSFLRALLTPVRKVKPFFGRVGKAVSNWPPGALPKSSEVCQGPLPHTPCNGVLIPKWGTPCKCPCHDVDRVRLDG